MMNRRQAATAVEKLVEEHAGLDARLKKAAVEGDAGKFVALQIRKRALPYLTKEAKAVPIRDEIDRLEEEQADLQTEAERMRLLAPPAVPRGRAGLVTPLMLHNARIAESDERVRAVHREIDTRKAALKRIDAEGSRPLL